MPRVEFAENTNTRPTVADAEVTAPVTLPVPNRGGEHNVEERIYDASCLRVYLECPTEFYYKYVLGYRSDAPAPKRDFGSAFHEALFVWYTENNLEHALEQFDVLPADTQFGPERGKSIFKKYVKHYETEPFKVLDCEIKFQIAMPGGSVYAGRIDAVVEWDNQIYAMDHKTTGSVGLSFFNGTRPNIQFDGYAFAVKEQYGRCSGVIVNGIATSNNPKERFARDVSARTERELKAFVVNYGRIVRKLEHEKEHNVFMQNTANCGQWGGCKYRDACVFGIEAVAHKFIKEAQE